MPRSSKTSSMDANHISILAGQNVSSYTDLLTSTAPARGGGICSASSMIYEKKSAKLSGVITMKE